LDNKLRILHFYVFSYGAYLFLSSEFCANKLVLHSKLMIIIGYKNNSYCFIYHIQGSIIFYFTHAIFNKEIFPKYTDSHAKECKLYSWLLDKISLEIELSVSNSFRKNRSALVPILHTPIPSIQNNPKSIKQTLLT